MIYFRWFILCLLDWVLLLTVPVAAPLVALFTQAQPWVDGKHYEWGWIWGTYDNPPQGDQGYVAKRCPFPHHLHGVRGYINRGWWMIRNPLYGFARLSAIDYSTNVVQHLLGQDGISDKDKRPGWYFVRLYNLQSKECVGFEFYGVFPYTSSRNVRVRLGWKILTDKFKRQGFAQLVNTFNPFDGYGDK